MSATNSPKEPKDSGKESPFHRFTHHAGMSWDRLHRKSDKNKDREKVKRTQSGPAAAGTYVSLTLLSKQSSKDNNSSTSTKPSSVSSPSSDWITSPQPADVEKDEEFTRQKLVTIRHMYVQAAADYERIKREFERSPGDKLSHHLTDAAKTLRSIEEQLASLQHQQQQQQGSHHNQLNPSSTTTDSDVFISPQKFSPHNLSAPERVTPLRISPITGVESSLAGDEDEGVDVHSLKDSSEHPTVVGLWDAPRHKKTESMPETLYDSVDSQRIRKAAIPRSVSDVSDTHRSRMKNADSCPTLDQKDGDKSRSKKMRRKLFKTQSMPASMYDSGSMSDSPVLSRAGSPTAVNEDDLVGPSDMRRNQTTVPGTATVPAMLSTSPQQDNLSVRSATGGHSPQTHHIDIINMEDDDFSSEDEHQFDDHGPFTSLNTLMKYPAHLAVFLSYLVSNQNPAGMFFYLMTEAYCQGSHKEMRKWAYELHSTFLNEKAPLHIPLDDDLVSGMDTVLLSKWDREDALRTIFDDVRQFVKSHIIRSLQEFCHTRSIGLGSLYGDHELTELDQMDRSAQLKVVDQLLSKHLEDLLDKEEPSDRNQAIAMCLGSFMKRENVSRTASNSRLLDRVNSFNEKDKRMFRFKGNRKIHYINNHALIAQHYFITTYCHQCAGLLWGVGNQGFQCNSCDQNYHKHCLDNVKENCSGQSSYKKKDKSKRTSFVDKIITRKPSNNSPTAIREAQLLVEGALTSPSHSTGSSVFHVQETVPEDDVSEDRPPGGPSRVEKLVNRYQKMDKDGVKIVDDSSPTSSDKEGKRDSPVSRSESLKGRQKEKHQSGSVRRTKSDVAADDGSVMKALQDQVGVSSSSSSLSTKSTSPSTSLEHVNRIGRGVIHEDDSDFEVEAELPALDTLVAKDVLKKLKPKEKKRQEVINELFYTERSHLRNLKILDQVFYQPWLNDPSLPNKLVNQLLPNIGDLVRLHGNVNDAMKARRPETGQAVGDVADIMLDFFEADSGDSFKKASAIFCRNHRTALDALKIKIRKDQKLATFLQEAEANTLCRRLKMADLIPMQMQRLTKYRLLVENLLKYTHAQSAEHARLQRVLQRTKEILHYVNQAVRDCENQQKLESLQKRMEKRQLPEYANDPQVRNLDLTKHKLLYDGYLMLKDGKSKMVDVHVVLLEDILVILQKQDDKLILKPLSSKAMNSIRDAKDEKDVKYTSPVVQLAGLLTRIVATDNRAFFLVSISLDSHSGSRMYELHASTMDEMKKWFKYISEASEAFSKNAPSALRRPPKPPSKQTSAPHDGEDGKDGEADHKDDHSNLTKNASSDSLDNVGKMAAMVEEQAHPLLSHHGAEVGLTTSEIEEQHLSPREILRRKDRVIETALMEKHKVIAQMLGMPPDQFENIAELASAMTDEKEPRELIVAAILQTSRLTTLAKDTLQAPPQPSMDSSGEDSPAPLSSIHSRETRPDTVHLPVPVLLQIVTTLNDDLTQLLRIVREREEEMASLRNDLKSARNQLTVLQEHEASMASSSRSPGNSRPSSFISLASELSADETGDDQSIEVLCSTPQAPIRVVTPHDDRQSSSQEDDGQLTPQALDENNKPNFAGETADKDVTADSSHIQITIDSPSPEKADVPIETVPMVTVSKDESLNNESSTDPLKGDESVDVSTDDSTISTEKDADDQNIAKDSTDIVAKDANNAVVEKTSESVAKDASESVAKDATESDTKDVTESIAKDATESVAKDTTESVAKDATESVAKDATESVAKDVTESVAKDTVDSVAKDAEDEINVVDDHFTKEKDEEVISEVC